MDQNQQNKASHKISKRPLSPQENGECTNSNHGAPKQPAAAEYPPEKLHTILRCGTCKLPFISREKLSTHYRVVHNYLHCHTCKKTFSSRMDLQEHYNLIHKANKTYCVPCNISFKAIEDFIAHCNKIHKNKNPNDGENSELAERNLSELLNNSEEQLEMTFQCKVCKSIFPSVEDITTHYSKAHKFVSYKDAKQTLKKCTMCPKSFVTSIELVLHCKRAHNSFAHEDFICDICDAEFGNFRSLNEHCERVHVRFNKNLNTGVMKCQLCSKQFENIHKLSEHTKQEHK